MTRDSALQGRIHALETEIRDLRQFGSRQQLSRAERRLAMLLEDERRPTFDKPAEFGRADEYTAWRKEQGL